MSWNPNQPNQGQDPNPQGQYGGSYNPPPGQYSNYNPPPDGGQPGYQYNAYGQSGYQPPYGTPPMGTASPPGPSSIGMDPKIAAGLGYLVFIIGIIFYFIEKQNRFVKFHALQATFLHLGVGVVELILCIPYFILVVAASASGSGALSGLALLFGCLMGLLGIAWFVGWLVAMIQAFQGKYFKFPLIGDWADRIVSKTPGLV
ncbi:MAG: DUF4870 domain-containing protein [Ktedonobacteraceae bacterium]